MISAWPVYQDTLAFPNEGDAMEAIMTVIKAVRNRRAEMNVPPSRKAHLYITAKQREIFEDAEKYMIRLACASGLDVGSSDADFNTNGCVSVVTESATVYMPMSELVDLEAERKRLQKELENVEKQLAQIENKLSNQGFLAKAPANVIEDQKRNREKLTEKADLIKAGLRNLG